MKNEMQLNNIDIIFRYNRPNGQEVAISGSISSIGWQQWNATKDELADNVELIEEMTKVASQYLVEE